ERREVGGRLLQDGQGLAVCFLRLLRPARFAEEKTQVVVTTSQVPAEFWSVGEVGGPLLMDRQGVGGRGRCLRRPSCFVKQDAQVVVSCGQVLAKQRAGGEFGHQGSLDGQRVKVGSLCFRQLSETVPHSGDTHLTFALDVAALRIIGSDRR